MASQATIENLLTWKTDEAAVARAVAANKKVEASSNRAALQFGSAAQAAQALGLSTAQMQQLGIATDKTAQSVGYLAQRLEEAARVRSFQGDATGGLRNAAFGGSSGGAGNQALVRGLFNARQAAIALPGVSYQSPLTVGIRGLEIVAEKTGASVGKLATGLGVVGAASVAVAIAFDQFNKQIEQSKKLLEGALAAQNNYYDALGTLTTDQVDEQISTLQRLRPVIQQQVDELQKALDSAFSQAQQTPLGDIGARALFNQLPTGVLQEALDEAQAALNENIQTETRLTQGRESGVFAMNDAIAAEAELQRQREIASREIINNSVKLANDAARAQTLTNEERRKEISALEVQKSALIAAIQTYHLSGDAIDQLNNQIDQIDNTIVALSDTTLSYADVLKQLDDQQQALSDATDNYFDALEREGTVRDEIADITQDITDTLIEQGQRLSELQGDRVERLLEAETDAGDRRVEIAEDAADKIYKIERDFGRSRIDAIRDRNIDALIQARQSRADELEDQQKADEKQQERLNKALAKQEAAIERSFDKQVRQVEQAYDRELGIKRQRLLQANTDLENLTYAQQQIALSGSNNLRIIHTQMWTDIANVTLNYARSIVDNMIGIFSAGTPLPPPATAVYGTATVAAFNPRIPYIQYVQQVAETSARNAVARLFEG